MRRIADSARLLTRSFAGLLILLAGAWAWAALGSNEALAQSRASVVIQIVDSDEIVAPGDDVSAHIFVRSPDTTKTYELQFFHAVGGPAVVDDGTKLSTAPDDPSTIGTYTYVSTVKMVVPIGSPHRDATLSAVVHEDGTALTLAQATLTIGDAGDALGGARISSSFKDCETSGARSSTSLRTLEMAYLKLEVLNSLGNAANDWDVKSVFITAAGAKLTVCGATSGQDHHIQIAEPGAEVAFFLETIDRKPVHIDVYAFAIGADGSARSNTLVVNFAGQADSLRVGEPGGTLAARHGKVRIPVAGLDSGGNRDDLSMSVVEAEVSEGPEEADLSLLTIGKSLCTPAQRDCEDGDVVLLVSSPTAEDEEALHGTYTIEVKLTTDPEETVYTAEVQVVGEPVAMTLELLDGSDPDVRRMFTASRRGEYEFGSGATGQLLVGQSQTLYAAVTMRDERGVMITETSSTISGDGVRFQIAGSLDVTLFTTAEQEVIDGVAYIRFLVAGQEGRSLVIATSRDLEAHASIVAREEARFGLDGLIKVGAGDFTTWIGQNSVQVSELWPLLAGRGISSVHLFVGAEQRWQRYSVQEGEPIPGSVDFLIAYGDTLWLSG